MKNMNKTRKAFSLVELVVVILIIAVLAVAVFAGGSAAIKKSQVSRTTSDLHNFSIAIESAVNETPKVANMQSVTDFDAIVKAVGANLPADYALTQVTDDVKNQNLNVTVKSGDALSTTYQVYQSAKTDAWDNPYYVIFDCGERHCKGQSDYFITVVSAGPNAQTNVAANIEADDIFLLVQYSDGDVSAVTYNCEDEGLTVTTDITADATTYKTSNFKTAGKTLTVKGVAGTMMYAGGTDNTSYLGSVLPVNF